MIKRLLMILSALTLVFAFNVLLFGQNRAKAKSKSASKAKTAKTKPVSGAPQSENETTDWYEDLGDPAPKKKPADSPKTESSVFEPNDANTWIKDNPKENAGATAPNKGDGKIMDIVDMAKQPEGQNSTQTNKNPKQKGVAQVGLNKKPQNLTGGTVIVSSKTSKPKRKVTKRKPQ